MSLWTVSVVDTNALLDQATRSLIDVDVQYVMAYLDQFIDWKGTLDVKVNIKSHADLKTELGWEQDGIIPATEMSWFNKDGQIYKSNLVEMTTGEDKNGDGADAGFTIYLGQDGKIRNYGVPVWLDPNPVSHQSPAIPAGSHDFVSIALHEVLHTLAFDQANVATSTLGSHVVLRDGVYYFEGKETTALLGQPLAFDAVGHVISAMTPFYKQSGMVSDRGNYQQNRWDIGRIELAVMKDLGIDVTSSFHGLSYTDMDDKMPNIAGVAGTDKLYGDFQANIISGLGGNDLLEGGAGNDQLLGGEGMDTALYAGNAAGFNVVQGAGKITVSDTQGYEGVDTLESIERIVLADSAVAFDIEGNAGKAYRMFQAAFDRAPDLGGVGFWMFQMDRGASVQDLAAGFIVSDEFAGKYGLLSSVAFITALYGNVLDRQPDQGGLDFWMGQLAGNDHLQTRAGILAAFSESAENIDNVAQVIGNGISYVPYG